MVQKRTSIHIATKDRHSELALLLQSLRTQSYQDWDLVIIDESQTPLEANYFLTILLNMIKQEGHYIHIYRNPQPIGVCYARNLAIEQDYFDNEFVARLDDDVILEADYFHMLFEVIEEGYDIASGVTPNAGHPQTPRNVSKLNSVINRKEWNNKGELTRHDDDCGYLWYDKTFEENILPTPEFRSNALIKAEVVKSVKYPTNLSPVGFREESFFSTKALLKGYKIGINIHAVAWHLRTPSGGCRYPDYAQKVQSDNKYFVKWLKEVYKKDGGLFDEERLKANNS